MPASSREEEEAADWKGLVGFVALPGLVGFYPAHLQTAHRQLPNHEFTARQREAKKCSAS